MNLQIWVPAAALLLLAIAAAGTSAESHGDHMHTKDAHHGRKDDKHGDRHHKDDKHDDRHHKDDKHDDRHHKDDKHDDRHHKDDKHHKETVEHHDRKEHEAHQIEAVDTAENKAAREVEHDEEQEKLVHRLDQITARLQHIDDELEKRLDPELKIKAQSLLHRLEKLEENDCEKDEYECGGFEPECIGRLFVCDGHKDCHNGDDEAHCDAPTKEGDTFVGHVVFDHCSQRKPENMSFTITGTKEDKSFTPILKLKAEIHIAHEDDDAEGEVVLPTVGYYRFATQNLVLLPPEDDRLGLICDFDGSDPDRCVGNIVRETSLEPCAQFIFHREEYDGEHDHASRH